MLQSSPEDPTKKTHICKRCLCEWAKSKLSSDKFTNEEGISCPNTECKHTLTHTHLIEYCGPKLFEEINQVYTDNYISRQDDMRRCPRESCQYAGSIELRACREKLECTQCGFEWREKAQISYFSRISSSLFGGISNLDLCSYLNEVMTGNTCPRCEEVIWKDGGCSHMNCGKCKYEFCWHCMGHYPGYDHKEPMPCGFRQFLVSCACLLSFILLYTRLSMNVSFISSFNYLILRAVWFILGYVILPNFCLLVLIVSPFICIKAIDETRKESWLSRGERICKYTTTSIVLFTIYPLMLYLSYLSFSSPTFCFLPNALLYEFWIFLYCSIIFIILTICYFTVKFLYKICRNITTFFIKVNYGIIRNIFNFGNCARKKVYLTQKETKRSQVVRSIRKSKGRKRGKKR